ncbi:MAG: N(2)-fixation sustaining protein CowN [Rhodobacteraceae bacterium]|nr:N(2)-fixation sustaining protein CowN [Paracoccaceae bacterium]
MTQAPLDRYVSFLGMDCDGNADRLMAHLAGRMRDTDTRWTAYFDKKLIEKERMGNDNLYFIGSQMNTLSAFFEEIDDAEAQALLWHLEQNCC